jgi:hypothetical protein
MISYRGWRFQLGLLGVLGAGLDVEGHAVHDEGSVAVGTADHQALRTTQRRERR